MNARYCLPYINRFISPDTLVPAPADPQSFNRYSYSYNNPLKYRDPSGHCATDPKDEYYDYECWQLVYQLQEELGLDLEFLSLFDLTQLRFFQGSLIALEKHNLGVSQQVLESLSGATSQAEFLDQLREPGGWDAIGVRLDGSVSGLHRINGSADFIFNFSSLELSAGLNINWTFGIQAGLSGGGGVFIGFNAPSNEAFGGWGSGIALSAAFWNVGGAVQWDVSNRLFLLGNMMPDRHAVRPSDTMNLTVMYTGGAEIEFSATLVGYSWIFDLYQW